jgi:hypothetical protein
MLRIALTIVLFGLPQLAFADKCQDWFQKTKIQPGENCLMKCSAAPVGMGTFYCNGRCEEFCKIPIKEKLLFKLSELYPGLTADERKLASKDPIRTLKAYQLSWAAEQLCAMEYFSSRTNDESDACRHFVWAAFLSNSVGTEFAEQVLNAHEQDPKQPEAEKAMDLANNRLGLLAAERLKRDNLLNDDSILSSFKEHLKKGDLIVIRKRGIK